MSSIRTGWLALLIVAAPHVEAAGLSLEAGAARSSGSCEFTLGSEELGNWSRVRWPLDGTLAAASVAYEHNVSDDVSAFCRVEAERSISLNGTSQDWDWRPWERAGLSDYSEADSAGEWMSWDLVFGTSVHLTPELIGTFSVGYHHLDLAFEDRNLTAWYDYGDNVFAYSGLTATYELASSGIGFGVGGRWHATDRLSVAGGLEYLPSLQFEGEGNWVRADKRFSQRSNGSGMEYNVELACLLTTSFSIALQYQRTAHESGVTGRQWGIDGGARYDTQIVRSMETEFTYLGAVLQWRP